MIDQVQLLDFGVILLVQHFLNRRLNTFQTIPTKSYRLTISGKGTKKAAEENKNHKNEWKKTER